MSEVFPNEWENVAGVSRLRVPGGWLVEWPPNDTAPTYMPDPGWTWVVASVEPVPEPVPEPAAPPPPEPPVKTWHERCRVLGAGEVDRLDAKWDNCARIGGAVWASMRVAVAVRSNGVVTLLHDPSRFTSGVTICDGDQWSIPDDSPLRAEAERVLAAAEALYAHRREAAALENRRREQETADRNRALIAAAEAVLLGVSDV